MASITDGKDAKRRLFDGKGFSFPFFFNATSSGTGATANSGYITCQLAVGPGTTYPGTLVSTGKPSSTDDLRISGLDITSTNSIEGWLGYFYRFGTATMNSTSGNRLTHDGTFTRVRRTRFGTADTPIPLIPLIYTTTASTTTVCQYTITYVDQSGNTGIVSPTNQAPAAATAVQTLCPIKLAAGDNAILDITAVTVSVATTNWVVSIFGFEPLVPFQSVLGGLSCQKNAMYGGVTVPPLNPATPDAGSFTQALFGALYTRAAAQACTGFIEGFNNT